MARKPNSKSVKSRSGSASAATRNHFLRGSDSGRAAAGLAAGPGPAEFRALNSCSWFFESHNLTVTRLPSHGEIPNPRLSLDGLDGLDGPSLLAIWLIGTIEARTH